MNPKHLKMLSVLAACSMLGGLSASAQDKATLDLLVKKGVITQADADSVAKSAAVVAPKDAAVKKLQIEGMIQLQYDWLTTDDKAVASVDPASTNQALIRRAYLGAIADLGNGWGGELLLDVAAGANASAAPQAQGTQNLFEKVIIYKTVADYGTATAGFQKVPFVVEENTSSSQIKTVERSVATRFFTEPWGGSTTGRLGFANRHVGLYWSGNVTQVDGLGYGLAVTNAIQSTINFGNPAPGTAAYNEFGVWGNISYGNKFDALSYKVGLNLGYAGDANSTSGAAGVPAQNNAMWGYNPYLTLTYSDFTLTAEFIQAQIQNGRVNGGGITSTTAPYGFNVTPSYKINDEWEAVMRFSYLSTNGRGASINQLERNAANPLTGGTFNNVWAAYIGFNYYIIGNSLKLSAGYEFADFTDRSGGGVPGTLFTGPRADVSAVRTRLQLLF